MRARTSLLALLTGLFVLQPVFADDHKVEFDKYSNFAAFKTFALHEGKVNSPKPELNNPLVIQNVGDAIRAQLTAKGLREISTLPDLTAAFSITTIDYQAQRGGPSVHVEGTLVIDLTDRNLRILAWRGVYRDTESNAIRLSSKFTEDVKTLLAEYPPRQTGAIPPRPPSQAKPVVRVDPKDAAIAALEVVQSARKDTSYVGPNAHPGLNVRLEQVVRTAQAVVDDDVGPAAAENRIKGFRNALNEAADFAAEIANNPRETPDSKQRSLELASKLRALGNH
jgi:hypothetical protein